RYKGRALETVQCPLPEEDAEGKDPNFVEQEMQCLEEEFLGRFHTEVARRFQLACH
ncbi:hypothetical protein SK128_011994, partial [Halocaridina rubra]